MAQVFFQYSNCEGIWTDHSAAIANLADARDHATQIVRSLIMTPSAEDWRSWVLHVRDELGNEILALPFISVLGKPH